MTDFASNPDNFCYRHPKRQSFVLCQRCARTVCGECQTPASVGVICPECLKDQRRNRTPAQRRARRRWQFTRSGSTPMTFGIIGVTAVVYLLQMVHDYAVPAVDPASWLMFYAPLLYPNLGGFEPWRPLTVVLVHGSLLHVGLNMLTLWMIGQIVEPALGRVKFLVLYLLFALGGSVAVALVSFTTPVVGASGAIFGLFGLLVMLGRERGGDIRGILVIIGINLVLGFLPFFHVAWQAHLGGLAVGFAAGFIVTRTRGWRQGALLGALAVVLIALFAVPPLVGYPTLI